jgi:hypothetical protein
MRKMLLITILFFILMSAKRCYSQLNAGFGLGYDTHGRAVSQLGLGYETRILHFNAEIRPSLSRNVASHNYIGLGLSANLAAPNSEFQLLPGIGYYYDDKSHDDKTLNKNFIAYSLKAVKLVENGNGFYLQTIFINKSLQITLGAIVRFFKD